MPHFAHNPDDGVELAYDIFDATSGDPDATPVLLVHGSGLSKAIWRGLGYVKVLREGRRVITVDLRGHGRSGKPATQDAYTAPTMAADILAVLDAAGAGSVHYLGYSLGARLGFGLAVDAPWRLRSFTSLGGTYKIAPGSIGRLFFTGYDDALGAGGMPAFVEGWERQSGHRLDPATRAAFLANDAPALRAYFRATEADPAVPEPEIAAIAVPTLLMAGTADRARWADSRHAAELIPGSRFVGLPGRDHGTTLFPPGPVLAEVLPFLAGA
ncbi:alpha/beta fold hydrolase [Specibacter cremeus]|uniref:alpha/beta fold hydrolase n=1 Tax=Specibacter cremeus TaxID=1629051 RepID=UPI000F776A88|nr:alpha/beta hydrolase [Specibacter cremeus]